MQNKCDIEIDEVNVIMEYVLWVIRKRLDLPTFCQNVYNWLSMM